MLQLTLIMWYDWWFIGIVQGEHLQPFLGPFLMHYDPNVVISGSDMSLVNTLALLMMQSHKQVKQWAVALGSNAPS
jgi:hypothetical protein